MLLAIKAGNGMKSKARLIALAAAALVFNVGCTTTRYITRDCVSAEQLAELKAQEPPKVSDRLTGKADEDVRVVAGSALRLRGWGHNMLDVLKVCANP
jgi:hypothetical protein